MSATMLAQHANHMKLTTDGNLSAAASTDISSTVTAAAKIPVVGLACQISGTRQFRFFQVPDVPATTGFDATLSDPYIDTPAATTDKAIFDATTAKFDVGIKSVQPPAGKNFTVGDIISVKVQITSTAKSIKSNMNKLSAATYTTSETVFTAAATNINGDGSLSASVSASLANSCG